jgi:hypothetical protein
MAAAVSALTARADVLGLQTGKPTEEADPEDILLMLTSAGAGLTVAVLVWLAGVISTGALAWLISQRYLGRSGSVREAYSFVMTRIGPLLATTLLVGLVVGIGSLLCLAPGIILGVIYIFHVPVVVIEGLSTTRAMSRSQWLVSNDGWRVFVCALLLGLLAWMLPTVLLQVPTAVVVEQLGERIPAAAGAALTQAAAQLGPLVFAPVWMCGVVLLYYDERIRKEGYDLAAMAYELGYGPPPDEPGGPSGPTAGLPGQTTLPPPAAPFPPTGGTPGT